VTALDPDAVQVLAAQLHAVQCLPGSRRDHSFSAEHRDADTVRARLLLTGLAEAGYILTIKEN
jgi:hypothetical protein